MGGWINVKDNNIESKYSFGPNSSTANLDRVYVQFTPGHVVEAIINSDSDSFGNSDRNINAIKAVKYEYNDDTISKNISALKSKTYYPLLRGITDVPTQGDQVLLCDFGGINYYIGPLNTLNNPNFNPDHLYKMESSKKSKKNISMNELLDINPQFTWRPAVKRLQKPYSSKLDSDPAEKNFGIGDMLFEGRFGNSIRIGSRSGYPNIFISNGRNDTNTIESLKDGGLISISSKGKLSELFFNNFNLASHHKDLNNPRKLKFKDEDFTQILIKSNRIIFSAEKEKIILSSFSGIDMGSGGNINIYNKGTTTIESSNIYLGKNAEDEIQPMVLGKALEDILTSMIDAIGQMFVGGTVGGVSTPINAAGSPGWIMLEQNIKAQIKNIKSYYHFIEDNNSGNSKPS